MSLEIRKTRLVKKLVKKAPNTSNWEDEMREDWSKNHEGMELV